MNRSFKIMLVISGCALLVVIFLFSPYFYVKEVTINGCEKILKSEIEERAGLTRTTNLLFFNQSQVKKKIMENIYIDEVTFEKKLPNALTITIRERHLSGYVEYLQGKYLYLDENGRVLEINSFFTEKYPVVSGLKFNSFQLGEVLDVEDKTAFKAVVTYARLLNKHQLTDFVSRIDVSDSAETHIILHHIDFNVGDGKNADEKVRTIKEIAQNLPNAELIKGFVDLKEIRPQYFFKILM